MLLDKSEAMDNGFPGISRFKLLPVDKNATGIGSKVIASLARIPGKAFETPSTFNSSRPDSILADLDSRQGSALSESRKRAGYFGQSAIFFGFISPEMIFA